MNELLQALSDDAIAVSLHHNFSQKVTFLYESLSQGLSCLVHCSQSLSYTDDKLFKGDFENSLPGARKDGTA